MLWLKMDDMFNIHDTFDNSNVLIESKFLFIYYVNIIGMYRNRNDCILYTWFNICYLMCHLLFF